MNHHHHPIPYGMSHFPVSPLDIEFLLAGLEGLTDDDNLPTDDDLSKADYDDSVQPDEGTHKHAPTE